jgi:hypothetical protein
MVSIAQHILLAAVSETEFGGTPSMFAKHCEHNSAVPFYATQMSTNASANFRLSPLNEDDLYGLFPSPHLPGK